MSVTDAEVKVGYQRCPDRPSQIATVIRNKVARTMRRRGACPYMHRDSDRLDRDPSASDGA